MTLPTGLRLVLEAIAVLAVFAVLVRWVLTTGAAGAVSALCDVRRSWTVALLWAAMVAGACLATRAKFGGHPVGQTMLWLCLAGVSGLAAIFVPPILEAEKQFRAPRTAPRERTRRPGSERGAS